MRKPPGEAIATLRCFTKRAEVDYVLENPRGIVETFPEQLRRGTAKSCIREQPGEIHRLFFPMQSAVNVETVNPWIGVRCFADSHELEVGAAL